MMEGSEGRDTDGSGSQGIVEEKNRPAIGGGAHSDGADTDGAGSTGMVGDDIRPARPGETDTTRFGMEPSEAEELNATGGAH